MATSDDEKWLSYEEYIQMLLALPRLDYMCDDTLPSFDEDQAEKDFRSFMHILDYFEATGQKLQATDAIHLLPLFPDEDKGQDAGGMEQSLIGLVSNSIGWAHPELFNYEPSNSWVSLLLYWAREDNTAYQASTLRHYVVRACHALLDGNVTAFMQSLTQDKEEFSLQEVRQLIIVMDIAQRENMTLLIPMLASNDLFMTLFVCSYDKHCHQISERMKTSYQELMSKLNQI